MYKTSVYTIVNGNI